MSRALALWDLVEKAPPPRGKQERRKKRRRRRININSPHKNENFSSKYLIFVPVITFPENKVQNSILNILYSKVVLVAKEEGITV